MKETIVIISILLLLYHLALYLFAVNEYNGWGTSSNEVFRKIISANSIEYNPKTKNFSMRRGPKVVHVSLCPLPNFMFKWLIDGIGPIYKWSNAHKHLKKIAKGTKYGKKDRIREVFGE